MYFWCNYDQLILLLHPIFLYFFFCSCKCFRFCQSSLNIAGNVCTWSSRVQTCLRLEARKWILRWTCPILSSVKFGLCLSILLQVNICLLFLTKKISEKICSSLLRIARDCCPIIMRWMEIVFPCNRSNKFFFIFEFLN